MSIEIPARFHDRIASSEFVWFTTVRDDGTPQPSPVWYVQDGDTFLLYSMPNAQKVTNIRANPKVALSWSDDTADEYIVVTGEARIDQATPPANQVPAYLAKYRDGIGDIGYTPETHAQTWSLPIRVTPAHVRGQVE